MACLTNEQLARLALGIAQDEQLTAHVEHCEACRAKLAEMGRLTEQLSAAHAEVDRAHGDSRDSLLAAISTLEVSPRPAGIWNRLASLTVRQRIAMGSAGLSAIAALILILIAMNSAGPLSAMERMAKELREVKSYSYQYVEHVAIKRKGKLEPGLVDLDSMSYWQAPGRMREEIRIFLNGAVPEGYHRGQLETDIVLIWSMEGPGILIDKNTKTYSIEPKVRVEDTGSGSLVYPMSPLRTIREQQGKVLMDLGDKVIQGKKAHGYLMTYDNANHDPMEIWLDPETDLPVEVAWESKDETTTSIVRLTDFRWNIDLDPALFDISPPEGYVNVTAPNDTKSLAAVSAVLKLYLHLSGGHYPQIDTYQVNSKFDADAIYAEMLKMAGFTGPARPEWSRDQKFVEIQQAKPGLDWIAKILLNAPNAGYHGSKVGPQDKDKILLWWLNGGPEGYRVFYGDLRTKTFTDAEAKQTIPPRPKIFAPPAEEPKQPAAVHEQPAEKR